MKATLLLHGLPPQTRNPALTMRKTADKPQLWTFYKIPGQYSSKLSRLLKNKENLRSCHSLQEPEEMRQLNRMWYSGWDQGAEKYIE